VRTARLIVAAFVAILVAYQHNDTQMSRSANWRPSQIREIEEGIHASTKIGK